MSKGNESGGEVAMGCALILIMIPIGILLKGFVLCKTWMWFMVPLGVIPISQAHAYGLTTMAALFITHGLKSSIEDEEGMGRVVLKALTSLIVYPLLVWGIAYTCYSFM